jgi:hypothetical protein
LGFAHQAEVIALRHQLAERFEALAAQRRESVALRHELVQRDDELARLKQSALEVAKPLPPPDTGLSLSPSAKPRANSANPLEVWSKIGPRGGILSAGAATWTAVHDVGSNLMWAVNSSIGSNFPNPSAKLGWRSAQEWLNQVNRKKWCGYADWRLPTREELLSLCRSYKQKELYIQRNLFRDTLGDGYAVWSSSQVNGQDGYYWLVNFGIGKPVNSYKTARASVRVVRMGR